MEELVRPLRGPNALLMLVAVLAGWGSMASASRYLEARVKRLESQTRLQYTPRPVIVAKQDLEPGTVLAADVISVRQMPSGFLPSDVLDGSSGASLLGRHLSVALRSGDPGTERVLEPRSPPSRIQSCRRVKGMTVAVDEVNSLSGMLSPEIASTCICRAEGRDRGTALALLLEQVHVLATGNVVSEGAAAGRGSSSNDYSTVTLLVDAEQAGRIILAQRTGSLSVALRPVSDTAPSQLHTRDSRRLLQNGTGIRRSGSPQDHRIELLLGGYGGPAPRRELLLPGLAGTAEDRS